MLKPKPPIRFLIRGSAALIAILALWWLALQPPMLYLLRMSESAALRLLPNADSEEPIEVNSSGDWDFHVAVSDTTRQTVRGGPIQFRSVDFTIPRADVVLFTFSLPVYWAIVLAVPIKRSGIRAFLWGTALVSAIQVVSLLALAEIEAYSVLAQLHPPEVGLVTVVAGWARQFGNNLLVGVVPFATPVVAAVVLHGDLRSQIFAPQGASRSAVRNLRFPAPRPDPRSELSPTEQL
jgi:hypothetical protein